MTDWPFGELEPGKYKAILADPPWGFKTWSGPEKKVASRGTVAPYSTMEMKDIGSLPVSELAAPDCCLFMWFVWPTLPEALKIIEQWGFTYKTCAFSWMKADPYRLFALEEDVRMGLGYWTRANTEACLLAVRGKPRRRSNYVRQGIIAPIRQHSRKPECVHGRIEELVVGPYAELFARHSERPGWDYWGNQLELFNTPIQGVNQSDAGQLDASARRAIEGTAHSREIELTDSHDIGDDAQLGLWEGAPPLQEGGPSQEDAESHHQAQES